MNPTELTGEELAELVSSVQEDRLPKPEVFRPETLLTLQKGAFGLALEVILLAMAKNIGKTT